MKMTQMDNACLAISVALPFFNPLGAILTAIYVPSYLLLRHLRKQDDKTVGGAQ